MKCWLVLCGKHLGRCIVLTLAAYTANLATFLVVWLGQQLQHINALEVFSLDYWQFQCPKSKVTCMYQRPSFCETLHGNSWHCTVWVGFRRRRAYDPRQTENKVSFSTVRDATRQALNTFHTNALVNSSDTCILLLPDFCVALQHDGDLNKFQNQLRWNWLSKELWLKFTISSKRENIGIHADTTGYLIFPIAMLSCLMASG